MEVEFKDLDALVEAMVASGVQRDWIEVHKEPALLQDWKGRTSTYRWNDHQDPRFKDGDKANVIVRRSHLGSCNNDFGIALDAKTGKAVVFLCDFSRQNTSFNDKWLAKIRREYTYAATKKHYASRGQKVHRVDEGNKIHLFVGAG